MFAPVLIGKTYTEDELAGNKALLKKAMNNLEMRLNKHKFLCGDEVSIADLSACFELDQTRFISFNLDKWPKTKEWLHMMIDENPINL